MTETVFPELWRVTRIENVCQPIERVNPRLNKEGNFRYIDISSIDNDLKKIVNTSKISNSEAPSRARQLVSVNDVLVSTVRPNLNAVALVTSTLDNAICSTGFCVLRCNPNLVVPEYLFAWVRHPEFVQRITRMARGISYPAVSDNDVYKVRLPLPPVPEQIRIVGILSDANELHRIHQDAAAKAQELIPAIFHQMFGDPVTNPRQWPTVKLEKVCTRITDGTHQSPDFDPTGGIPFLFVSNIVSGKIDFDTEKFIRRDSYESLMQRCPVELGDVLYSIVGSYGVAVRIDTEQPFAFQRHIAHLKPDHQQINSVFLTAMLNSAYVKAQADRRARGIAQKTVNLSEINKFDVFLPPKQLQDKFAELILEEVETLQHEQSMVTEELDNLFQSLLINAFDGELTRQYREQNRDLLATAAAQRDEFLGHAPEILPPSKEMEVDAAYVVQDRPSLAHALSPRQRQLFQMISDYLEENDTRYLNLTAFIADHLDLSTNVVRQNVDLFEKVGLLTRVSLYVEPEGLPFYEPFYRFSKSFDEENVT